MILRPMDEGSPPALGVDAARALERTCDVLAQLINVSLTWVFLIAGIAQAVSLIFLVAGQVLASPVAGQVIG